MTAFAQNFRTFTNDAALPIFTVQDKDGNPVDISSSSDIRWFAQRTTASTAVLSKTKTAAQIKFVTDGTNGQFEVIITGADTSVLSGVYQHYATVVDGFGDISTVALGQMTVGRAPTWTYDPTQLDTSTLMQVRNIIGDVYIGDQQLQDEEINWNISRFSNFYSAAAECCRDIAARYARKVDTVQGELRILYSAQNKAFQSMATRFDTLGMMRGATPYAGGISAADKNNVAQDSDRVPPDFVRAQWDDILPVGPVGQQTNVTSQPDVGGEFGNIP